MEEKPEREICSERDRQYWIDKLIPVLFILLLPLLAHVFFTTRGFNLSEDGLVLAQSRRLLSGQIPCRDFILTNPPGSAILRMPILLVFGNYSIWMNRLFGWFQITCIAWLWILILEKTSSRKQSLLKRLFPVLAAFIFMSLSYDLSSNPVIDGLFLLSIALYLVTGGGSGKLAWLGWLISGFACLMHFAFFFFPFAAIIVLGKANKLRYWILAITPSIIFILFILLSGSFNQALDQIGSGMDLSKLGFAPYLWNSTFPWIAFVAIFLIQMKRGRSMIGPLRNKKGFQRFLGLLIFILFLAYHLYCSGKNQANVYKWQLYISALGFGGFIYFAVREPERKGIIKSALLILILCWCASSALMYDSPGPVAGLFIGWIIFVFYDGFIGFEVPRWSRGGVRLLTWLAVIVLLSLWVILRLKSLPPDVGKSQVYEPLGKNLYGAAGIKARKQITEVMEDLSNVIEKSGIDSYGIVPGIPSWWLSPRRDNPLPVDVYHPDGEFVRSRIIDQLKLEEKRERGKSAIIIQKYLMRTYPERRISPDQRYPLYTEIRKKWKKKGESKYFIVYE